MLLFYEAVVKIQKNTLKSETTRQMVYKAIRFYMREQDLFSDYLPPKEYDEYKHSQSERYTGVGMDIFNDHSGRVVCIPFPDGPASEAGVDYGDVLTFVDNHSVDGKSVFTIGSLIRGNPGTSVSLVFQDSKGATKQYSLRRRQIKFRSVILQRSGQFLVLKIIRFTNETSEELRSVLDSLVPDMTKIIDLRGNTGGDLFEAIDTASMFLDSGTKIVDLKTSQGIKTYAATRKPIDTNSKLFLWQDGFTASAAEVFIAALVQNGRGISIGQTTFGKGVSQCIIELTDGSALFVSNAALRSPNGDYFHLHGLEPEYAISGKSHDLSVEEYASKTVEINEIE